MKTSLGFDLKTPCSNCPFRRDALRGWLGEERAKAIALALDGGNTFTCHKTKDAENPQMCAGALVLLKRSQGGFSGALSMACAFDWLDPHALDTKADVFESLNHFVAHHSARPGGDE